MVGRVSLPQHGPDEWHRFQSGTKHEQTWNVALDLADEGTQSASDGVGKGLSGFLIPMTSTTAIAKK